MDITEVRVFPVNEERLKAYVTITLDNCFVVRDLKVINGNTGLFVAMPAKRRKDGTFKDIAHPLNSETRERMEKVILAEYDREVARGPPPPPRPQPAGSHRRPGLRALDLPEADRVQGRACPRPVRPRHLPRELQQGPGQGDLRLPGDPGGSLRGRAVLRRRDPDRDRGERPRPRRLRRPAAPARPVNDT